MVAHIARRGAMTAMAIPASNARRRTAARTDSGPVPNPPFSHAPPAGIATGAVMAGPVVAAVVTTGFPTVCAAGMSRACISAEDTVRMLRYGLHRTGLVSGSGHDITTTRPRQRDKHSQGLQEARGCAMVPDSGGRATSERQADGNLPVP